MTINLDKPKIPSLVIRIPTAREEFCSLLDVLKELPFFLKEGYKISLPDNPRFKELTKNLLNQRHLKKIFGNFFLQKFMMQIFLFEQRNSWKRKMKLLKNFYIPP